jgi:hypothetical protein
MGTMNIMLCLVCKHGFSWRIAPLERVCAQCGTLHTLRSGIWELAPRSKAAAVSAPAAFHANGSRAHFMKIVPDYRVLTERQVRS